MQLFIDAKLIDAKRDAGAAEGTITNYERVQVNIGEFFPEKRLSQVTSNDAKEFWQFLRVTKGLGENTARRRFGRTREIFNDALERELIGRNPFKLRSIPVAVGVGEKAYVPPKDDLLCGGQHSGRQVGVETTLHLWPLRWRSYAVRDS